MDVTTNFHDYKQQSCRVIIQTVSEDLAGNWTCEAYSEDPKDGKATTSSIEIKIQMPTTSTTTTPATTTKAAATTVTGRKLHERIMEHLRYIKKGINALGEHFRDNPCDSSKHLKFQIIEQVFPNEDLIRLHREKLWIDKLNVKEPNGLNRMA